MSGNVPAMYALVDDGIYVGNISAAKDLNFLANADVSAIINLSGKLVESIEDVDVFEFLLPSQELMDSEIPKTNLKLDTICTVIHELRANNRTVLIQCADGKNKCMLAAGYYLISKHNRQFNTVIEQLEMLYLSPQQKSDELDERARYDRDPEEFEREESALSPEDRSVLKTKRAARRNLKCLTMASFRKILRLKGGAKK